MRVLIHGSEHPRHAHTFVSLLEALTNRKDEYVFLISNQLATPLDFNPSNWFSHRFRDILWDWFSVSRNRFRPSRWNWKYLNHSGELRTSPDSFLNNTNGFRCSPIKGFLPWKPDVILCVTPHEGHVKYQLIPWANKNGIPVISLDHGAPMVHQEFGGYRGSMMGCVANVVWGKEAATMNASYGAPSELQIVCGSPTLDDLAALDLYDKSMLRQELGIAQDKRIILLMTTHRDPLKSYCDEQFIRLLKRYENYVNVSFLLKPHPVELLNRSLIDLPPSVTVIDQEVDLHRLIAAVDLIISPASSVVIPAMALTTPFVNLLHPNEKLPEKEKYTDLAIRLGKGILNPEILDEVIEGEINLDVEALDEAFIRFGYSKDGRNGKRIVELCHWISEDRNPAEFKCSFDIIK